MTRSRVVSNVRVAIVGAGLMGRWHAREAIRAGGTLAVVVDPDADAARRLAVRYGARTARSLEDLSGAHVDVAHLCTPSEHHATGIRVLLDHEIHVLAEKPLAPTADVTRELLTRAAAAHVLLCPVHQLPFQRGLTKLLALLSPHRDHACHVDYVACSSGARTADELDRVASEILPHPLSLIRPLLGVSASAPSWSLAVTGPGELRVIGRLRTASVALLISMRGRPPRHTCRIITPGGTLYADFFHGYALFERPLTGRGYKIRRPVQLAIHTLVAATANLTARAFRRQPAYPGLRELITAFYGAISRDEPAPVPPDDTHAIAVARDHILELAHLPGR